MLDFLAGLGGWNWIILGFLLLGIEILVPGVYLLWIGVAALLTGALSLQLGDAGFWGWPAQTGTFLVLSLVSVVVGRHFFGSERSESDEPHLNRREHQLIGQVATLEEPVVDGRGRVRLGDTLWLAEGPDLPAGMRVRVVSAEDGRLRIEPL